jgi:hypothetical protein
VKTWFCKLTLAGTVAGLTIGSASIAQARSCSDASLKGKYGQSIAGEILPPGGPVLPQNGIAMTDFDGNGTFGSGSSGFGIATDDNAQQGRAMGGCKAMAYIDPWAPGGIAVTRCYNSQQTGSAVSTPPCGIVLSSHFEGGNTLDFGFEVDDRFVTTTAFLSAPAYNHYQKLLAPVGFVDSEYDQTNAQVIVLTFAAQASSAGYGGSGLVDVPFWIVVY